MAKARVKKGDMVVVISGKDKDLTTPRRVLQVDPSKNRVLVEGVNMVKRHTRPNPQRNNQGGIVEREAGGRPSAIQQWMRRKGVGWNATDKALRHVLPGSNYICDEYESAASITREHIIEAFRTYYVPGNMALVVVGM